MLWKHAETETSALRQKSLSGFATKIARLRHFGRFLKVARRGLGDRNCGAMRQCVLRWTPSRGGW